MSVCFLHLFILINSPDCAKTPFYLSVSNAMLMFRYIQCRGGRPALSTCKTQLYFDYILLSCTLKKDARCIQD